MTRKIEDILGEALECSAERRLRFLEEACGRDLALRSEVESLIRAHERAAGFLAHPTALPRAACLSEDDSGAVPTLASLPEQAEVQVGPYKLLERIGEGGFGVVFMAEQQRPVVRRVALKLIKPGMDTHQVIARFDAERQALAMMDHPNIARVLDAGATDAQSPLGPGRPYFVMELVRGVPITTFCDERNLPIRQRLELFGDVCHAVQHAHQKGIIHRDIKPSNVLVTQVEGGVRSSGPQAVPKIIDFGIAKATGGRLTDKTLVTELRQLIGTPAYMSPEQAGLSELDIDTRSDIYALGVLLYELLAGTTPFDSKTLLEAGYDEMRRIIREVEPPRPSTRLSSLSGGGTQAPRHQDTKGDDSGAPTLAGKGPSDSSSADAIAGHRHTDAPTLRRMLRGELDWIVMKCLEKDRARRYQTANGLATDLRRYLNNEPVVAAPPSRLYRFRKSIRRNGGTWAAALSVFLVLLAGIAATWWQARSAQDARDLAEERRETAEAQGRAAEAARGEAEAVTSLIRDIVHSAEPDEILPRDYTVREALDAFDARLDARVTGRPGVEAKVRLSIGEAYRQLGEFDKALRHLSRVIELKRSAEAERDLDLARALNQVALVHQDRGEYAAALPLLEEALALKQEFLGELDAELARGHSNLGNSLHHLGRFEEAEVHIRRAMEIHASRSGPRCEQVGFVMYNLVVLQRLRGRWREAEALARESLEILRETADPKDPYLARSIHALGGVLLVRGKLDEAERYIEEARAIRIARYGEDHAYVAASTRLLGDLAVRRADLARAEELYRSVLAVQERRLGVLSPVFASTLRRLANLLEQRGAFAEEEGLLRVVLAKQRDAGAAPSSPLRTTLGKLTRSLVMQRRFVEAEPFAREFLATQEALPAEPPRMAASAHAILALTLAGLGNLSEAEEHALSAEQFLSTETHPPEWARRSVAEAFIALYEARHALEPDGGYDAVAAEWRQKLESLTPSADEPTPGPAP